MAYQGMIRRAISGHGQLSVPEALESAGVVAVDEPAVWGALDDGVLAILSRTRDAIDTHPDLSVAGTSIPDPAGVLAVPVPVFEMIEGISPGEPVVFVSTRTLSTKGAVAVVPEREFSAHESRPMTSLARLEREDGP